MKKVIISSLLICLLTGCSFFEKDNSEKFNIEETTVSVIEVSDIMESYYEELIDMCDCEITYYEDAEDHDAYYSIIINLKNDFMSDNNCYYPFAEKVVNTTKKMLQNEKISEDISLSITFYQSTEFPCFYITWRTDNDNDLETGIYDDTLNSDIDPTMPLSGLKEKFS